MKKGENKRALLYEINNSVLTYSVYLKVFDDHVEIKPFYSLKHSIKNGVKVFIHPKHTELIIANDFIERVDFKPAKSILCGRYLQFFINGENIKKANFFTREYHPEVYIFNNNDVAEKNLSF